MALRTSDEALWLAESYARIAAAMRLRDGAGFQRLARIYDLACDIAIMKAEILPRNDSLRAN